ncbi:MAG: aldo/keto reductase [Dehalococcoidia bacterium]
MGTWSTFDVHTEREIAVRRQIIDACVAHGVSFLDSSPMYGESERVIGTTIQGRRERFHLATKVWTSGREQGEAQIARSFQLLGTDYIDVLQVHNLLDWRTHLLTLERLREEGRIGLIGITHYGPSAYAEMARIMRSHRVNTIQVPYNVVERECERELLPLAQELGIGVIVMRPLGGPGFLAHLRRQPDLALLREHGIVTWAQALLAWVLADRRVSVVIPATSRPKRIEENAVVGDLPPLPEELRTYVVQETQRCR